jgi:plastocyanin
MTYRPLVYTTGVAALVAVATGVVLAGAAGGNITGSVKTGRPSDANVVVYVEQVQGTFPAKTVQMNQKEMQFIPHVLPIVVGTTVSFLNSDPTPHNVFSPDNDKYNLGTWPQGQTKDHAFASCAKAPCVYQQLCRVHPDMLGYIVVLQNPYFAVTDKTGRYDIKDVPPGSYTIAAWSEKGKAQPKPVTVEAGKPVTVDFTIGK